MSDLVKKCTEKLRVKTRFWLITDENEVDGTLYPFDRDKIPIMCNFRGSEISEPFEAYESGNRSILFHHDDAWFKAKGVGIPRGIYRPTYDNGRVYTYQLDRDLQMCHRSVLWGFMEKQDLDYESFGTRKVNELGIDIEPIGFGVYNETYYITFKDRREMFQYLKGVKEKDLQDRFSRTSKRTKGYSFFAKVASDLRVQELLYTFMFPEVSDILDKDYCKDYVRWLGSSCGYRLRQLHDAGILHGTWIGDRRTGLGLSDVHSNSYIGNHTIEEEETGLIDFDLTETSQDDYLRKVEKWCLIHMENPLFYAGSYMKDEAPNMGLVRKNPFREKLAEAFESGIDEGYRGEVYAIEKNLRRDMLEEISEMKRAMWELYGLPKDLIGDIYLLEALVLKSSRKDKDLKDVTPSLRA